MIGEAGIGLDLYYLGMSVVRVVPPIADDRRAVHFVSTIYHLTHLLCFESRLKFVLAHRIIGVFREIEIALEKWGSFTSSRSWPLVSWSWDVGSEMIS